MSEKTTGRHKRKSIRLQGFDYSSEGYYFLTLCTYKRQLIFGTIENGFMMLNESGKIAHDEWIRSAKIRNEISLGEFVVMPNHIHGIVIITRWGDRPVAPTGTETGTMRNGKPNGPKPGSIGAMIAGYKSAVTTEINRINKSPGNKIWQRNYYDHIIRSEIDHKRIADYIINNPRKWEIDENYRSC